DRSPPSASLASPAARRTPRGPPEAPLLPPLLPPAQQRGQPRVSRDFLPEHGVGPEEALRQNAAIRVRSEQVDRNYARSWKVEGKGFVDCGSEAPDDPAFPASSMPGLVSSDGSLDGSTASERKSGEEQGHVLQHIDL